MKTINKRITADICKKVVFLYLGNKCAHCDKYESLELHHIIPIYIGGKNELSNLELVCHKCHSSLHTQFRKIFPYKRTKKCDSWVEVRKRLLLTKQIDSTG